MTMNEGARIYAPGGRAPARGRARSTSRASCRRSSWSPRRARAAPTTGRSPKPLLELMDERGGLVTREDLDRYEARWSEPVEVSYAGTRFLTRGGLSDLAELLAAPPAPRRARPAERALVLARTPRRPRQRGRHDEPHGRRRRGQRVRPDDEPRPRLRRLRPRLRPAPEQHARRDRPDPRPARARRADGEHDGAEPGAGRRRASRSPPARPEGRACAARCSRSSRGSSTRGSTPQAAVDRPRLHPADGLVNLEPGFEPEVADALEDAGLRGPRLAERGTTTSAASAR